MQNGGCVSIEPIQVHIFALFLVKPFLYPCSCGRKMATPLLAGKAAICEHTRGDQIR